VQAISADKQSENRPLWILMSVRAAKYLARGITMKLLATTLLMSLFGAFSFYMLGLGICSWLYPDSNLVGLPAACIAAPIGFIVGGIAGLRHARPPRK
jgi:hypothetical protein